MCFIQKIFDAHILWIFCITFFSHICAIENCLNIFCANRVENWFYGNRWICEFMRTQDLGWWIDFFTRRILKSFDRVNFWWSGSVFLIFHPCYPTLIPKRDSNYDKHKKTCNASLKRIQNDIRVAAKQAFRIVFEM